MGRTDDQGVKSAGTGGWSAITGGTMHYGTKDVALILEASGNPAIVSNTWNNTLVGTLVNHSLLQFSQVICNGII